MPDRMIVDAVGIAKTFGRVRVLRDVTLRVRAGETVAIFGPNGAGKSTLLRLCATLYQPTSGTLTLFGERTGDTGVRRRIGLLSHQSFLYPDLSARENLLFYAHLYGLPESRARVDLWLARVGLAESAERSVRVFSRGMEQRLALARTLLHDPELLVLDEPWSALDAAAADLLSGLLHGLHDGGRTLLLATHDFDRALAVADRVIILHDGRIVWESSRAEGLDAVHEEYRRVTGAVAA